MEAPEPQSLLDRLIEKFNNSRFFTISFVLHVLLISIFGGTVLFEAMQEPPDFEGGEGGFVSAGEQVAAPPPVAPAQPQETTFTVTTPPVNSSPLSAITTTAQNPLNFSMDAVVIPNAAINPNVSSPASVATPGASMTGAAMTGQVAAQIREFTGGWGKGSGSGTGTRQREFEFTAYVAQYSGGNWDSTFRVVENLPRGALPNLLEYMSKESRNKVKTNYQNVKPIKLDSAELFTVKPPFIFFTGSQDFILTEKEVENLQKYVRLGGAIWGDSSVPGLGSRFDMAFRREMKRVMPDIDKDFEPLDPRDPLFTRNPYFPEIKGVPRGINYYDEPVFVMRYFDQISIIYTANDYGDMWEFGIKQAADGKSWVMNIDRDAGRKYVAQNDQLIRLMGLYIHNVNPTPPMASIIDCYKFGTNMIIHLLTRWEEKLRTAPRL
jgi:hypothetical protein